MSELSEENVKKINDSPGKQNIIQIDANDKDLLNGSKEKDENNTNPITPINDINNIDDENNGEIIDQEDLNLLEKQNELNSKLHFEEALRLWHEVNVSELQKRLDTQGEEIVENQKKSLLDRKELAAKTKEFKKLDDEGKLKEMKFLLKSYQTEIDSLTKRSKFCESAFLSVYKVLAEVPDPYPLLEAAVDSYLSSLESARLASENSKLKAKLSLYSDYNELKEKLKHAEKQIITVSKEKVALKENEFQVLVDEKERNWKNREEELQNRIQAYKDQIKDLHANQSIVEAQLNAQGSVTNKFSENNVEFGIVTGELERANRRILEAENRNVQLRQEIAILKGSNDESTIKEITSYKDQILTLKRQSTSFSHKIESLNDEIKDIKNENQKKIIVLERDITRKDSEISSLRDRLKKTEDYDEIKRDLEILKEVELSTSTFDDDHLSYNSSNESINTSKDIDNNNNNNNNNNKNHFKNNHGKDSLESMLFAKNKKLNNDLIIARNKCDTLTEKLNKIEKENSNIKSSYDNLKSLNEKLEEDLSNVQDTVANSASSVVMPYMNSGASIISSYAPSISNKSGRISPTTSIISGRGGKGGLSQSALNKHDTSSILPIITSQRDRFRKRNSELEEELRNEWNKSSSLRNEVEKLKRENTALYERSRFLTSYRATPSGDGTNSINDSPNSKNINNASAGDISFKYQSAYESRISPFEVFRERENERAMSKLTLFDRIIYSFSRIILANRTFRNMFALYCFGLHLMILLMIWYVAYENT